MKFTCDNCNAQYLISDEKVGPTGVKVRCKKCGNVVVVRRAAEVAVEAPAPVAAAAAAGGTGLDVELGQAFDTAFGDPPAQAPDLAKTQAMGADDASRIAAPAAEPATGEWYVAIGQAQVGPLPLAEVKRKWEAGDVGPDSLVWRPGMGNWQPLSSVAELAGYLAPVPRAAPQPRTEAASRPESQASRERPSATPAPAADVTWKPVGASALATLANEEIAARAAPEPKPAAARAPSAAGARSLVDGLPDGGGVDPTGAIPLSIKGLDTTGDRKLERRSSVASRAEKTRHKRSVTRAVVIAVVIVLAVVGGAAAYVLAQMKKLGASPAGAVATSSVATQPVAPPAPPPPAVAAAPSAPAASAPAPATPPAAAAGAAAAPPAAPAAVAPPTPIEKSALAPEPGRRVAKAEPGRMGRRERREAQAARAAAAPAPAEAAPAPAPTPRPAGKRKDSLLDFDSNDAALDDALGAGGGAGRTVYVPPPRAGGSALPEKLSPAQINESVAGRIDSLRKCVSEQKARDPGASGILKLRWVIGGDGNVRDVKTLTTEYASSPFSQCVTGVVKTIKFPRSTTAGQEVTFPFSF